MSKDFEQTLEKNLKVFKQKLRGYCKIEIEAICCVEIKLGVEKDISISKTFMCSMYVK